MKIVHSVAPMASIKNSSRHALFCCWSNWNWMLSFICGDLSDRRIKYSKMQKNKHLELPRRMQCFLVSPFSFFWNSIHLLHAQRMALIAYKAIVFVEYQITNTLQPICIGPIWTIQYALEYWMNVKNRFKKNKRKNRLHVDGMKLSELKMHSWQKQETEFLRLIKRNAHVPIATVRKIKWNQNVCCAKLCHF